VAQRGGGVAVAEAGLGLEQPPVVHQVGGHAVTLAVQGRMLDSRSLAGAGKAVGESRLLGTPAGRARG
jgi:hypothetical protein